MRNNLSVQNKELQLENSEEQEAASSEGLKITQS